MALLISISHPFLASLVDSRLSKAAGPERKDQLCVKEGTPVKMLIRRQPKCSLSRLCSGVKYKYLSTF